MDIIIMKKIKFLTLGLLAVIMFSFTSCDDDDNNLISTVNFDKSIYNLTTEDLSAFPINLTISPALSNDSEFTITFSGADAGTAFTTTPPTVGNSVTVPVPAGANRVTFTFTPLEAGIQGGATINMALTGTGEGLTTGIDIESVITVLDVGTELPLVEGFDDCQQNPPQPIPNGWVEAIIQQNGEGSTRWRCNNNGETLVINAFVPGSEDPSSSEAWLVTPRLNLTEATNPVLSFDVSRRFPGTGNFPEDLYDILISTDYSISVEAATWQRFGPGFDAMTANDPGNDAFTNTGDLSLSRFIGQVIAIAFVYRAGSPGGFDSTILRIDNVSVTDN